MYLLRSVAEIAVNIGLTTYTTDFPIWMRERVHVLREWRVALLIPALGSCLFLVRNVSISVCFMNVFAPLLRNTTIAICTRTP